MVRGVVGVRHPADVHQLDEKMAASSVNPVDNAAPARDMLVGIKTRRIEVTLAVVGRLRPFGNEQSECCALPVIFGGQQAWRSVSLGTAASHGRHGKAVPQGHI